MGVGTSSATPLQPQFASHPGASPHQSPKTGPPPDVQDDPEGWFRYHDRFGKEGLDLTEVVLALAKTFPGSDMPEVRRRVTTVFNTYDKDQNGVVSLAEFVQPGGLRDAILKEIPAPPDVRESPRTWFLHFDRNNNGLDENELARGLASTYPGNQGQRVQKHVARFWSQFEKDRSGRITLTEFMRRDGLRRAIAEELDGGPPPDLESHPGHWFRHYDRDHNGLDQEEVASALWETYHGSNRAVVRQCIAAQWANFDRNGSGRVDFGGFMSEGGLREAILEQMRSARTAEAAGGGVPHPVPPPDIRHHPALWFRHFDRHFNGMDLNEVVEALVETFPGSERGVVHRHLEAAWGNFDKDRSGRITLDEFYKKDALRDRILSSMRSGPPPNMREYPGQWFRHFDRDWIGLDKDGLIHAIQDSLPRSEPNNIRRRVSELWPLFRKTRSGRVDVMEFVANKELRERIWDELGSQRNSSSHGDRHHPAHDVSGLLPGTGNRHRAMTFDPQTGLPEHPDAPIKYSPRQHGQEYEIDHHRGHDRDASHGRRDEYRPLVAEDRGALQKAQAELAAKQSGNGLQTAIGLLLLPRVFGILVAGLIYSHGETAYYDEQMAFFSGLTLNKWCYLYLSAVVFSLLVGILNIAPVVLRSKLPAFGLHNHDVYVYKMCSTKNSYAKDTEYIVLEEQGLVGEYNRANRSLHHFGESAASVGLSASFAGAVFPLPVLIIGVFVAACRLLHQFGYSSSGRAAGALPVLFSTLAMSVIEMLVLVAALKGLNVY